MKTNSRMRRSWGGWNCLPISFFLFAGLSLLTGCWNTQPKQDVGNQAAASRDSAVHKLSALNSADQTAAVNPHDDFGFKHTLGPGSESAVSRSSAAVVQPTVTPHGNEYRDRDPDDRYAGSTIAPAIGNRPADIAADPSAVNPKMTEAKTEKPLSGLPQHNLDAPLTSPEKKIEPGLHSTKGPAMNRTERAEAALNGPSSVAPPAVDLDRRALIDPSLPATAASGTQAEPQGNPLRDAGASTLPARPQDPPQVAPAGSGQLPNRVDPPAVAPSLPGNRTPAPSSVEMIIQAKTDDGSAANPAAAPGAQPIASPAAPSAAVAPVTAPSENQPQPKEHSLDRGGWIGPHTAKNSGVPFDPVKVNGPIFIDPTTLVPWPKPNLALVITGNQEGYLEPCGCAGLDRMKGGMSRRYSLFRELRGKRGWPVVGLDVGNIAKGFGKQAELKFQIAINGMNEMQYSAVTLGPTDLHLPTEEVMALTMPPDAQKKTMFVAGNVGLFTFNETLLPRTQVIKAGFKTIGITAVLGKTYSAPLAGNANLKIIPPEKVLEQAVPLLKAKANYLILLAQTTRTEAIDLATKYPDFDLVICSDHFQAGTEPPNKAEEIIKNGTKLIVVGEKGMYAVVLGLYDDPQQPLRYQRVTLDSRFPSSPEMVALMSAYQDQLKELGLSGLGIRPLENPLKASNGGYVGSEACKSCHEESYRVWKKSPHSRAFATLKNTVPPRNFDPECISCHTVGWNPAKFFPYESGYLSEKETPKLINVGCEDCHGPGQKHVWAENQGTPADQARYRKATVLTKEEAADPNARKQNCWSCHDQDNSPEFKFDLYWPYVKHYEKQEGENDEKSKR